MKAKNIIKQVALTIKFQYDGKKYTKKVYLFELATGEFAVNTKKSKDVCINDVMIEADTPYWGFDFEEGAYYFEVYFVLNTDVDGYVYYTFIPSHILVWSSNPDEDGIIDEIEIDSVNVKY